VDVVEFTGALGDAGQRAVLGAALQAAPSSTATPT
jgi:hypothetical protein